MPPPRPAWELAFLYTWICSAPPLFFYLFPHFLFLRLIYYTFWLDLILIHPPLVNTVKWNDDLQSSLFILALTNHICFLRKQVLKKGTAYFGNCSFHKSTIVLWNKQTKYWLKFWKDIEIVLQFEVYIITWFKYSLQSYSCKWGVISFNQIRIKWKIVLAYI